MAGLQRRGFGDSVLLIVRSEAPRSCEVAEHGPQVEVLVGDVEQLHAIVCKVSKIQIQRLNGQKMRRDRVGAVGVEDHQRVGDWTLCGGFQLGITGYHRAAGVQSERKEKYLGFSAMRIDL